MNSEDVYSLIRQTFDDLSPLFENVNSHFIFPEEIFIEHQKEVINKFHNSLKELSYSDPKVFVEELKNFKKVITKKADPYNYHENEILYTAFKKLNEEERTNYFKNLKI
ncbi:hypothetical protein [Mucilaginibacter gynuensis]|uniref:hypothetical protein n=1 Tax=Mucilaginibacter gynuensis TaxID=1302236 RepID=UPI0031E8E3C0